jgi:hypothetical protein
MADSYPVRLAQRPFHDPYADSPFGWYGVDPVFRTLVEKNLRDVTGFDAPVRISLDAYRLEYRFDGVQVPGDLDRHDLGVEFRPGTLGGWAAGFAPGDYPTVRTSVERPRKHHYPDESLCLWAPFDSPERRWWHGDGLHVLVEIVRRHLFYELHWWRTGGRKGGVWLGEEAPHGFPDGLDLQ